MHRSFVALTALSRSSGLHQDDKKKWDAEKEKAQAGKLAPNLISISRLANPEG
jgi:hypothetical protein